MTQDKKKKSKIKWQVTLIFSSKTMQYRTVIVMITVKEDKQRIDYLLKRDNVTDEELEEIYNEGVNQLRAIVDKSFNTYAVDGVLFPNDLARKVTKKI
ncbi:hypothetical protein [Ligilactobacillus salivarius]